MSNEKNLRSKCPRLLTTSRNQLFSVFNVLLVHSATFYAESHRHILVNSYELMVAVMVFLATRRFIELTLHRS